MKIIKLLALLLTTFSLATAQNFEGKVIYKNDYKSKAPNMTSEQFNSMMGTNQVYFAKEGNYKSVMDGKLFQWQLYINRDNKLYSKMSNSPTIFWNDGAVNADEVIKSEIKKGVTSILGHPCDELVLTCKNGVEKYYFSSVLKVDAKLFVQHKFGNWNEVVSRTGALPLKMIIETPQFILESIATEIVPMKLDDKEFELPAGSKVEKSPY
ncbi:MAG TPA: hypothetical protein VIU12_30345 [Chryseolinea sp.]